MRERKLFILSTQVFGKETSPSRRLVCIHPGIVVGNGDLCVCGACDVNIRQALKARDKGEPYQLRCLKCKRVCCVPLQTSDDVEQEELAGGDNVKQLYHSDMVDDTLVMVGMWKLKVSLMKAHES